MTPKRSFFSAFAATMSLSFAPAVAFSPTEITAKDALLQSRSASFSDIGISSSSTALHYKDYHRSYYESVDVDGDRMSLLSLLNPPAAQQKTASTIDNDSSAPIGKMSTSSSHSARAAQRTSSVIQLHSIQDYHRHVLNEPNQLCIIRFSAPWCKVCRATNVAWERMASRIHKMATNNINDSNGSDVNNNKQIQFLSVSLDGKNEQEPTSALRDMLQIKRVPQGIIHHPTQGLFGQKIDLSRSNLSKLKRQLETYLDDDEMESWMVLEDLLYS